MPSEVAHADFWQRYFYKVHQLEQDEARKAELKKRADDLHVDQMSWDGKRQFRSIYNPGIQISYEKLSPATDHEMKHIILHVFFFHHELSHTQIHIDS